MENLGKIILFVILYVVIPPGIFILTKIAKNQAKYAMFGRRRSRTAIKEEITREGINSKIKKRIDFTLRDPRSKPIPFRLIFFLIYTLGIVVSVVGGINEDFNYLLIAVAIAYVSMFFSIFTANRIVTEREKVLERMLELKGSRMKFVDRERGSAPNVNSEIKVIEWNEDLTVPSKLYLYMPTSFDILEIDRFMESFNLIFGEDGQWIADDTDEAHGGFDFNSGVAAIRVAPPLPKMAMWNERYLDPKYVHWSYFPLALGSENGVPVYNEEDDTWESVLGFAVNSGQEKLSNKNGVPTGGEITAAPQILIAGGTGGGKALSSETEVKVADE